MIYIRILTLFSTYKNEKGREGTQEEETDDWVLLKKIGKNLEGAHGKDHE